MGLSFVQLPADPFSLISVAQSNTLKSLLSPVLLGLSWGSFSPCPPAWTPPPPPQGSPSRHAYSKAGAPPPCPALTCREEHWLETIGHKLKTLHVLFSALGTKVDIQEQLRLSIGLLGTGRVVDSNFSTLEAKIEL